MIRQDSVTDARALYRVCCAAGCTGAASAVKKSIAVIKVNSGSHSASMHEGWEPRGRFSRTTAEREEGEVRLSGISLSSNRLVSSQIIAGAGVECRVRRGFCSGRSITACPLTMAASRPFTVLLGALKRMFLSAAWRSFMRQESPNSTSVGTSYSALLLRHRLSTREFQHGPHQTSPPQATCRSRWPS